MLRRQEGRLYFAGFARSPCCAGKAGRYLWKLASSDFALFAQIIGNSNDDPIELANFADAIEERSGMIKHAIER